jgi:hypothetical protein
MLEFWYKSHLVVLSGNLKKCSFQSAFIVSYEYTVPFLPWIFLNRPPINSLILESPTSSRDAFWQVWCESRLFLENLVRPGHWSGCQIFSETRILSQAAINICLLRHCLIYILYFSFGHIKWQNTKLQIPTWGWLLQNSSNYRARGNSQL